MTNKKAQPVGFDFFEKQAVHANRKEKFFLNEEQTEYFMYHPTFSTKKRDALMKEFLETLEFCNENKIDHFKTESDELYYLNFLIVKYFTDVTSKHLEDADYYAHVAAFDALYESGWLEIIVNEAFDIEEIAKVTNQYNMAKNRIKNLNIQLQHMQEENKKHQGAKLKEVARKSQGGRK